MKKILLDLSLEDSALRRLRELPGVTVEALPVRKSGEPVAAELLRGGHVLLCKIPPKNFDDLTDLELMQISSVGYEHLRHLGFADRPVRVCNARGLFDTAIAEWNVAMMLILRRDFRGMLRNQERAVWDRDARFSQEIGGQVVGLWGYGGIGRETARLAKAFGMTAHVFSRSGVGLRRDMYMLPGTGDPEGVLPDHIFSPGQELDFLASLDYLILALPHTQRTTGLIGARELQALRPTAFLLNPARGPIINEQALLTALRESWIAGAALDTHFAYPLPPEHPLWRMPNVLLTPHISGAEYSTAFPARMGDLFVQNVERYLAGKPLFNLVTAAEWREA
ncbi:MAG TPA: D-2-hydroxyacid dehydrogenase [Gemmataceae bacterium]|nr:D-2-hydroxyacid dehydrogenase [Gemmataceae bacterium]